MWVWFSKSTPQNTETLPNQEVITPIVSETQKIEKQKEHRIAKERASDALLSSTVKKERAILLSKKADYLKINNEYHDALDLYERVIYLDPQNEYKKKAASIAFDARNFFRSIQLYTETLSELNLREKEELLMSMRYTGDKNFQDMLSKIDIPAFIKQAYEVSWICENTLIDCEDSIRKYSFDYQSINALKKAFNDFKNLKNTDIDYREALLIGAFYQNKDYSTVIRIGSNLLARKPDYKPILKIIGFSSYLTNQFERAENALKKFKTLDSKDPEVDFIL
jgi:tetratricopeptide (TPR) repeat protein